MKFILESQQYGLTTKRKWFKGNKKPERYASTLDQAKYDKNSLERADGQSYVIIDTKTNQLVEDVNIREAKAEIKGNSEHSALSGTIRFKQIGDQVNVIIDLENLPKSKFLGFHIHAKGDCSGNDEDEFKNVGKHYNPSRTQHPEHAGDLTSIYSSNGRIHQEFETDKFTVDEIIGKSVIIHSDRDDFKSQPSGDSGDKIACGIIEALIGDNVKLVKENANESKSDSNKCALCGKEFKGYGNNGQPLVDGTVCDECNVEVIKARINKSNKLTEKVAVDYINLTDEQKSKLINQVRNFFKRNSRAYVLPSTNSDILEFISDLYIIDNQIDLEYTLADDFGITFPKGNLFKILHQFEEPKEEDSDYFDESVNQLKDMADEAKKKQKGLGAFVKLDAGNVEQNVATFNANMTPNIGEDLELSDEEVIEPRTINIKHELRNHDMDNDESFGNLSDMYEFLESELSIDNKKNIISFMLKGDYDSISKLLNDKIDNKLDSELGDLDRYVDKNYR